MKKSLFILFLFAVMLLIAGCTPQSSPRQVAKTYWTAVQEERFSEAVDLYYNIDGLFSEDGKAMLATLMEMDMSVYGKIKSVKVVSVEKSKDGKSAVVTVEITMEENPNPRIETMDVVKSDGKWYVDFSI